MPLFRDAGLTFIHIPKTAGTSIEHALGLANDSAIENRDVCFGKISSPDLKAMEMSSEFLQHLRLDEMEMLYPEFVPSSWIFTVVRDPWHRLLSSYRRKDRAMADFARWRHGIEIDSLNLPQYVELAATHDLVHLRPQVTFLRGSTSPNIFYFEHLPLLMEALSERLGQSVKLPKTNAAVSSVQPLAPRLEARLKRRVAEIYAEDYERFYPQQQIPEPEPGISGLIRDLRFSLAPLFGRR